MSPEGLRHSHGTLGLPPGSEPRPGGGGSSNRRTIAPPPHSAQKLAADGRAPSAPPPLVTPGGTYVWRLPPSRPVTSAAAPVDVESEEDDDDEDPLLSDAAIERELAEMARRALLSDLGMDDDDLLEA